MNIKQASTSSSAPIGTPPDASPDRPTPMIAQFLEIKAANPDRLLFYRMGDFYEMFFRDAEIASRILGIVLTKRGKHLGEDIPMCGVPVERSDEYLEKLISSGHSIAVCEQIEDPAEARKRGPKSVVKRGVVRHVTPGTITEERILDPGRPNTFVALSRVRSSDDAWTYGVASVDISTGAFGLHEAVGGALCALLARLEPREIVGPELVMADDEVKLTVRESGVASAILSREVGDAASGERRLKEFFGVATLDGFGALTRAEVAAAGCAISYVERTQMGARPQLSPPSRGHGRDVMEIDASTRTNLEITRTISGQRTGTLLASIDRTSTPAGSRLLAEWLAAPLRDARRISARQDAVSFLHADPSLRQDLMRALKAAPDMTRALGRLALGRGGPRDLAALLNGLISSRECGRMLSDVDAPFLITKASAFLANIDPALPRSLADALAETPPLDRRDGGFVRSNFDADLDESRALRDESRRVVAALQAKYAELADAKQIKVKHNNFLGYFVETPQSVGERLLKPPLNATFIHRQTMADAMRFSTAELGELEGKIARAADEALAIEIRIYDALAAEVDSRASEIVGAARALAVLDVFASMAQVATSADWTRPHVDESLAFKIEGGRHPVVEAALKADGKGFVANDCDLSACPEENREAGAMIAVVTGPNMAGKSTFLRQNALIAILAQVGSFVPAKSAHIGVVDRLFSRVGAADDLARGRSTFMVEMVETAAILNQSTPQSLVILDEIGRGTATYDGLSIAWAVMEHLHDTNRSRALFATHFHELTRLSARLPRLTNLSMKAADWNGDVVFLHEVAVGAADRSYGVQVARLAGLPPSVVGRARHILAELEATNRESHVDRLVDDLPLPTETANPVAAPALPDPTAARVRDAVLALDPDALSPREALQALYDLRKAAKE